MALTREQLREISRNAYTQLGAGAAIIGPVVPANAIRFVYFLKLGNQNAAPQQIILYRNGAVGTIVLDTIIVPGFGPAPGPENGKCWKTSGTDIEVPVYVLLEGEQMGGLIPAGVGFAFICYFDESG